MGVATLKAGGKLKSVVTRDRDSGLVLSEFAVHQPAQPHHPRTVGLGDLLATFAQPIAAAVDALTERLLTDAHRTELAKCSACARRHRRGNLICPDITTCPILAQLLASLPAFARDAVLSAAAKHAKPTCPFS
jgi:hypothetical protein